MSEIEQIFEDFDQKKDTYEISIEQLKNELGGDISRIVLYGAGSAGIAFFHYLEDAGIKPLYFADGDAEKCGKICEGIPIIPPDQIVKLAGSDALVIITINTDGQHYCRDFKQALLAGGHQGVHAQLKKYGCAKVIDYVYFKRCFQLFKNGMYNLPACADVLQMNENKEKIIRVFEVLEDDISKDTLMGILKFRMLGDTADIPVISEEKMYFEYELFPKVKDEIFVDCGACSGSSLKIFLQENQSNFKKYYGIEPDPFNYQRLLEYIQQLPKEVQRKIETVNAAAFQTSAETPFFVLNGPGTFASENGTQKVKTVTLDSLLNSNGATYIKMNIEGSEVPALTGARNVLTQYKPRLAIMGYHKTSDLWEVPLLIKSFHPQYKLFLRSYMKDIAFCYYAY